MRSSRWWSRGRLGSVRARTTVLAALVVGVALVAGSTVLLLTLRASLLRSGDLTAVSRARDLAALAHARALPRTVPALGEDDVIQVVDAEGHVVTASVNAVGRAPIAAFHPDGSTPVVRTRRQVTDGTELESYRVWGVRAATDHGPMFVYVGTSLDDVVEATTRLRVLLAIGLPAMLALLGYSTWLLLGRALRPVEAIRRQVSDISSTALDRRVPVPRSDDEISRLAETMNAMLERLETASLRQREFVADASHELQSPLTSFRAQLEVALAHPRGTDWAATASELLVDSDRMERIVADLLYLARTDALPPQPGMSLVDLDDIVLDETSRLRGHCRARLDTARVSAAPVRGSGEELRRMTRNLLDNAARHAHEAVRVELGTTGDQVVLAIEDDGPGVATEQRERIFERFVRVEGARSRAHGGAGLGLAIVRAVAERHQGTAALEPSERGARLVVRLPAPLALDGRDGAQDGHAGETMPHGSGFPSGPVPADRGASSMPSSSSLPDPPETPRASTGPTPFA